MRGLQKLFAVGLVAACLTILAMGAGTVCNGQSEPEVAKKTVGEVLHDSVVTVWHEKDGHMLHGGSGSFRVTKDGQVWIWTCSHIIRSARYEEDDDDGKKVVKFETVKVLKHVVDENGEHVKDIKLTADIIRYSDPDGGHDLALLRVREKEFKPAASIKFWAEKRAPPVGSRLLLGGTPHAVGPTMISSGTILQNSYHFDDRPKQFDLFTHTNCPIIPGCSGGPLVLEADGRFVGLFTLYNTRAPWFTWYVPVQRIYAWAQEQDILFATNDTIPVPSDEKLFSRPIDDGTYAAAHPEVPPAADPHEDLPDELRAIIEMLKKSK